MEGIMTKINDIQYRTILIQYKTIFEYHVTF